MKKHLISLFLLLTLVFISFKDDCGGKQRWNVKILADKEASKINWLPKHTTIKDLTKLVQPYPIDDKKFNKNIRFGYEFNVYEITCKIREYIKEEDGDYHLVLVDSKDTTFTMVGEMPNPDCDSTKNSKFVKSFREVRTEFEKYILPKGKVMDIKFTIIGICFFDKVHGQKGVAQNGVELHPIMDLTKSFEKY